MATIECGDCGNNVSDSANYCPHCGNKNFKSQHEERRKKVLEDLMDKDPIVKAQIERLREDEKVRVEKRKRILEQKQEAKKKKNMIIYNIILFITAFFIFYWLWSWLLK